MRAPRRAVRMIDGRPTLMGPFPSNDPRGKAVARRIERILNLRLVSWWIGRATN